MRANHRFRHTLSIFCHQSSVSNSSLQVSYFTINLGFRIPSVIEPETHFYLSIPGLHTRPTAYCTHTSFIQNLLQALLASRPLTTSSRTVISCLTIGWSNAYQPEFHIFLCFLQTGQPSLSHTARVHRTPAQESDYCIAQYELACR